MEVIVNEVTPQVTVNPVTVNTVLDSTIVNLNTPVPGKSAYQSALDNGFVGTEAEWLESLRGDDTALTSYEQVSTLPNYPTAFPPEEHNHDGSYAKPDDLISFITAEDLPDVSNFITLDDLPDTSAFLTSADLPDVSGFLTAADLPDLDGYATAAQGAKADTAVQPADLPTLSPVATSGSYDDLSGTPSIPSAPGDIGAQPAGDYATASQGAKADTAVQPAAMNTALTKKADLVDGKVPTSQIPSLAVTETFVVADEAQMLALDVQIGDLAVRTDGEGTFIASGEDTSVLSGWTHLSAPTDEVTSVNGQVGGVVLNYRDVEARSEDWVPEINEVPGLNSALESKQPKGSYASAVQGAKADTAVQPADLPSVSTAGLTGSYTDLINTPDIPTKPSDIGAQPAGNYQPAGSYATAAQGTKADSAVQPGDLSVVATTGAYGDLTGQPSIPTVPSDIGAQPAGSYATGAQGARADSAVQPSALSEVATTGSYTDLTDTPDIPALEGRVASMERDTGWVDLELSNGWKVAPSATENPAIRRVGNMVYLRYGSISGVSATGSSFTYITGGIFTPTQWRVSAVGMVGLDPVQVKIEERYGQPGEYMIGFLPWSGLGVAPDGLTVTWFTETPWD